MDKPPPKISLEELLRLKRHERPAAEFWPRFEGELRGRMLRAFVQPEPWVTRWSRALVAQATPWMTAGATAGLVLAFVMHSRVQLPTAENSPAPRMTVAMVSTPEKTAVESTVSASTLASPAPAGSADDALEGARTKFIVAALAEPSESANDHRVSATTELPGGRADGVRFAADALVEEPLLSRVNGMAY
ncbi:MAG: hypothetical protein ABSH19_04675 [Opitutales bacterium]|jgi:hypothetical protein